LFIEIYKTARIFFESETFDDLLYETNIGSDPNCDSNRQRFARFVLEQGSRHRSFIAMYLVGKLHALNSKSSIQSDPVFHKLQALCFKLVNSFENLAVILLSTISKHLGFEPNLLPSLLASKDIPDSLQQSDAFFRVHYYDYRNSQTPAPQSFIRR
jgi:hypothetical protein